MLKFPPENEIIIKGRSGKVLLSSTRPDIGSHRRVKLKSIPCAQGARTFSFTQDFRSLWKKMANALVSKWRGKSELELIIFPTIFFLLFAFYSLFVSTRKGFSLPTFRLHLFTKFFSLLASEWGWNSIKLSSVHW